MHLLLIFAFVCFICVEYLIPRDWQDSFSLSVVADGLFAAYILEMLVTIKFKHRKMLIASIMSLVLSIGAKCLATILLVDGENSQLLHLMVAHIGFLLLNVAVPLCLLLVWNKLKESKWRETFDLHTKLNSHLIDGS